MDARTGEKIFTELGRLQYKDNYLIQGNVEFRDAAGKIYTRQKIAVKKSLLAPDYFLEDLRDGHREGVVHKGGGYEIFFKKDAQSPEERIPLKVPDKEVPAVTFPGFSNFIVRNWDLLLRGEAAQFNLILPTERDYYRFRLVKDSVTGFGPNLQVHFRIEPGNFILRMFVDAIRISFHAGQKRLVRYEGIHFVRDLPKFTGRKLRVTYD